MSETGTGDSRLLTHREHGGPSGRRLSEDRWPTRRDLGLRELLWSWPTDQPFVGQCKCSTASPPAGEVTHVGTGAGFTRVSLRPVDHESIRTRLGLAGFDSSGSTGGCADR